MLLFRDLEEATVTLFAADKPVVGGHERLEELVPGRQVGQVPTRMLTSPGASEVLSGSPMSSRTFY